MLSISHAHHTHWQRKQDFGELVLNFLELCDPEIAAALHVPTVSLTLLTQSNTNMPVTLEVEILSKLKVVLVVPKLLSIPVNKPNLKRIFIRMWMKREIKIRYYSYRKNSGVSSLKIKTCSQAGFSFRFAATLQRERALSQQSLEKSIFL